MPRHWRIDILQAEAHTASLKMNLTAKGTQCRA
jgi:hypothetical protein